VYKSSNSLSLEQGIYSQKDSKKADFKKKNPFLSRIFLETEQEVFGYACNKEVLL